MTHTDKPDDDSPNDQVSPRIAELLRAGHSRLMTSMPVDVGRDAIPAISATVVVTVEDAMLFDTQSMPAAMVLAGSSR